MLCGITHRKITTVSVLVRVGSTWKEEPCFAVAVSIPEQVRAAAAVRTVQPFAVFCRC